MQVETSIRDDIAEFLQAHYQIDLDSVSADATMEDLGLDSLGVLSVADLIETKYGISLDDERIASVRTFSDLMDLIRVKVEESKANESARAETRG
ncbi:acyl carrier protein [Nocardia sp. CA2R105]|uniref:acyl carrier protein n=1 Tax=Nocardia coffeae TaxID=2873381 RepID=UPI001CA68C39|nr:acyl carrier protein [Nocardia coffeae]MBY8862211.1 acyl carrier protein [Nocardia coffeae]